MSFILGVIVGVVVETAAVFIWLLLTSKPHEIKHAADTVLRRSIRRLPEGVRRGQRPDLRRVVLRPVNKDQPPSRVTQALFRQRPTRKLDDDDTDRSR